MMKHHLRRCGAAAFTMVRCFCHFPHAVSTSPPIGWKCPSPRLYSTNEMNQQLPANLVGVMEQRMKLIEQRSAYLQEQINQPDASPEEYSRANKELHKLESTMDMIEELRSKQEEIEGLKSLMTNSVEEKDFREMAAQELLQALEEEKQLQHKLFRSLLPKDEADERDCILEVRAGTGGEEASLFAMDIFKMYEKYSQKNGWKFDAIDIMESALKGYKEASGTISGPGAYGKLKFESGIHRVQRVPVTEKSGRVHTSAVSVAILPQADEVDVQLRNEDLRIDTYRSGGSGGQSVNTTDSAVRITHVPTGTVVAIQDERSQHQNKAKALKVLRARLYEIERHRLHMDRSKLRSEQIGSGDRSERIRTYNFPQGRVTDHRVGITHHSIEDVMEGESLDIFIDALLLSYEMDAIASFAS
ncbi:peptide chain release factor 1, mitochondrial isoform X1 [Oryza glaberrima]|nr:peptide chain release factor 1, mitochondrial isoform X1 [Oryza glaberrima]